MSPSTLSWKPRRTSAKSSASMGPAGMSPALFTRMSTGPAASANCAIAPGVARAIGGVHFPDLLLGAGQRQAIARGQLQMAAFGRERMGGCQADAFGGAGDEHGLAFEFEFHGVMSRDAGVGKVGVESGC